MKKFSRIVTALCMAAVTLSASAATFMGTRDDFRDETIYFAMTTRFYDGDPKNNVLSWDKQDVQISKNDPDWRGDFAGLIEKLDYIKALGFTAIWITPITQNASGEDYHGYHSMDFSSVDLRYESRKEWGSAKDVKFQDLIDAAHKKGMKIILDIVLNHTSNFGETTLNPLFTRDQNIRNQATPAGALIPNSERLSSGYFDQTGQKQYDERFKYFKNPQYDTHNYYHHYGTGWNWDLPNRWWGQIAGDCVDLNTENDVVAQHLVKCYGEFIKMGVDGFRIDTTGHISRLTFNTQFIPEFTKLFEQYKDKRADGKAYLMFGECCARFGGVIYRDQHNLSSHFYTWKSDQSLINSFKSHSSGSWWDTQVLPEGHDSPVGPMVDCEKETAFGKSSSNVFMQNGQWHAPDYSQYSGFSVIDFPMHYNFNNAGSAINIAKQGDHYYNDASYNVVYVDSHDYCPGPNDGTRFNGGTDQWAENLSLMFTFRGIPCIYYGSEVEFKKGLPIDVGGENNKTPRSQSGRAYFGEYLTGTVSASDFGVYTASGNVAKTLNADLAQHIRRLNLIRAAVPALRKGQYTFDGCSGNMAFKRAYNKDGVDSYALVCINGGATFSNVPAGTYTDIVTGTKYTPSNGSITVSAPSNKGQLRVLVKNWNGGKVGEDGKFIYSSSPVAKGGNVTFEDPGTNSYYKASDVIGRPSVTFSPAGGSFRTETQTVTVKLNDAATSGWFQVEGAAKVNLTAGQSQTFTVGSGMAYGQSKKVTWGASDGSAEYTGSVSYKKVDPNAAITIYVRAANASAAPNYYMHAWGAKGDYFGGWPGQKWSSMQSTEIQGNTYYYHTFDEESINVIFHNNGGGDGNQTTNIENITSDTYFEYTGSNGYTILEGVTAGPSAPVIKADPASGTTFTDQLKVTLSTSAGVDMYYTLNGTQASASSTKYTGPITITETTTINVYAKNEIGETRTAFTYKKRDPSAGITIYVTGKNGANIANANMYAWDNGETKLLGQWPGKSLSDADKTDINGRTYYSYTFDVPSVNVIFNNNGGSVQTGDIKELTEDSYFEYDGGTGYSKINPDGQGGTGGGTVTPGDYHVFFDNSSTNWSPVMIHIWDGGNAITGNWNTTFMNETVNYEGNTYYHYAFSTESPVSDNAGIIFSNNGGNGDNQTENLKFVNFGLYNKSGFVKVLSGFTGIDELVATPEVKVYSANGQLVVYSDAECALQAVRLDGTVFTLKVAEGHNYFDLPKGFYIVANKKVII